MSMGIDEESKFATVGEKNKESKGLYALRDPAFIEYQEHGQFRCKSISPGQ